MGFPGRSLDWRERIFHGLSIFHVGSESLTSIKAGTFSLVQKIDNYHNFVYHHLQTMADQNNKLADQANQQQMQQANMLVQILGNQQRESTQQALEQIRQNQLSFERTLSMVFGHTHPLPSGTTNNTTVITQNNTANTVHAPLIDLSDSPTGSQGSSVGGSCKYMHTKEVSKNPTSSPEYLHTKEAPKDLNSSPESVEMVQPLSQNHDGSLYVNGDNSNSNRHAQAGSNNLHPSPYLGPIQPRRVFTKKRATHQYSPGLQQFVSPAVPNGAPTIIPKQAPFVATPATALCGNSNTLRSLPCLKCLPSTVVRIVTNWHDEKLYSVTRKGLEQPNQVMLSKYAKIMLHVRDQTALQSVKRLQNWILGSQGAPVRSLEMKAAMEIDRYREQHKMSVQTLFKTLQQSNKKPRASRKFH